MRLVRVGLGVQSQAVAGRRGPDARPAQMTPEQQKEELSKAYLLAVAARSGVPVTANQIGPCVQLFAGIASVPTLRHLAEVDKNRTLVLTGALVDRGVAPLPRGMMYLSAAHTDADIDATLAALGTAIAALA
jgi:glutamate-1-semialdehyde 2,1-aminomutase